MRLLLITSMILLFSSCAVFESMEARQKRLLKKDKRRIRKAMMRNPVLFESDTTYNTITVPVPGITIDSSFVFENRIGDCPDLNNIIVHNPSGKASVRIEQKTVYRDTGRIDSVTVFVECYPDSVTAEIATSVNTTVDAAVEYGTFLSGFLVAAFLMAIVVWIRK